MATEISVLHVVAGLHPHSGGPSQTVIQLTDALARQTGLKVNLLSQSLHGDSVVSSTNIDVQRSILLSGSKTMLNLSFSFRHKLKQLAESIGPHLIHSHGLWLPANHWSSRVASQKGIPLVIHPRGMLEPWAMAYRRWKKRLAFRLYQRRDLESAALFIATSEKEAESIRRIGLIQPIAIIPNGITLPDMGKLHELRMRRDHSSRNVLFLGRIHPIKGLLNLIDAWAVLRPENWRLLLAGPDESGYLAEVIRRVQEWGLVGSVEYLGSVKGERKTLLYADSDLFILPSFSENFGVVVVEALAHTLPVITTHGTPWRGLETDNCGWWIEPTSLALTGALKTAMSMPSSELKAMGDRGRIYAAEFDWAHIAQQTMDVYLWLLGRGPKPECVLID